MHSALGEGEEAAHFLDLFTSMLKLRVLPVVGWFVYVSKALGSGRILSAHIYTYTYINLIPKHHSFHPPVSLFSLYYLYLVSLLALGAASATTPGGGGEACGA